MSPDLIIQRCTRDGAILWAHVAQQLGMSLDATRRRYDPNYLHMRPWPAYCEEVTPEGDIVDENDVHSLAPKGPGMQAEIIELLDRLGPLTVADIAARLNRPAMSVRVRLNQLRHKGNVDNDSFGRGNGTYEWTWKLVLPPEPGVVTGYAEGDSAAA